MKLTAEDTGRLSDILATCSIGGIEAVIIEDGIVRGVNETKTCAIISSCNVPKLPQKVGLGRLSSLKQRLNLLTGAVIEAKESDRGEISSLEIAAGRNKVSYRCTSTILIKAPKAINDEGCYRVFISSAERKLVLDAIKVMGAKKVQLEIRKTGAVQIILSDATNDAFNSVLETKAERLGEDEMDSVVHYYPADVFAAVIRAAGEGFDILAITVGMVGTIKTEILGHAITLLPQINEDGEE
jgi:hypothetical protein